jgi:hypothetical protein
LYSQKQNPRSDPRKLDREEERSVKNASKDKKINEPKSRPAPNPNHGKSPTNQMFDKYNLRNIVELVNIWFISDKMYISTKHFKIRRSRKCVYSNK